MTKLNERIANVPERIFILAQLALGLLLAAGGGYCILRFGNDGEHFNSLGLAAALVLCGGLPTLIRRPQNRRYRTWKTSASAAFPPRHTTAWRIRETVIPGPA
mgnify:CR=1 FL=1